MPDPHNIPCETSVHPVEVIALLGDDECLSYLYGKEYDQTASQRVFKTKPWKEQPDTDDMLPEHPEREL